MAITKKQWEGARDRALGYFERAGIVLTGKEEGGMEIADFGLGMLETYGVQVVTYVNTGRSCAKEIVLFPKQICPEHRHPPVSGEPGKEETFRCRWGEVYLYVEGEETPRIRAVLPKTRSEHLKVRREVVLRPGEQYTLNPDTKHWFQGGPDGAVVSEFSTTSRDAFDIFTDPEIKRAPEVR
jgi:D-lyxose ketol-isomerase